MLLCRAGSATEITFPNEGAASHHLTPFHPPQYNMRLDACQSPERLNVSKMLAGIRELAGSLVTFSALVRRACRAHRGLVRGAGLWGLSRSSLRAPRAVQPGGWLRESILGSCLVAAGEPPRLVRRLLARCVSVIGRRVTQRQRETEPRPQSQSDHSDVLYISAFSSAFQWPSGGSC